MYLYIKWNAKTLISKNFKFNCYRNGIIKYLIIDNSKTLITEYSTNNLARNRLVFEEEIIESKNLIHQIWILSGEKEFDNYNINDLNEFNSIILIDYINKEDIINKIKFFEKMKNFSLTNCKKILININWEDFEDLNSILKENEIEYSKIIKNILIEYIKELFPIIGKDIIKYINLRKELNMKTFQENKACNKEKSKNENAKSMKALLFYLKMISEKKYLICLIC